MHCTDTDIEPHEVELADSKSHNLSDFIVGIRDKLHKQGDLVLVQIRNHRIIDFPVLQWV